MSQQYAAVFEAVRRDLAAIVDRLNRLSVCPECLELFSRRTGGVGTGQGRRQKYCTPTCVWRVNKREWRAKHADERGG